MAARDSGPVADGDIDCPAAGKDAERIRDLGFESQQRGEVVTALYAGSSERSTSQWSPVIEPFRFARQTWLRTQTAQEELVAVCNRWRSFSSRQIFWTANRLTPRPPAHLACCTSFQATKHWAPLACAEPAQRKPLLR
ncbi:hypothetical protein BS78_K148400 [Paspalum vaginatum]|uniref:Uncharacterized protein n=1 Tax=Paspalum vaginatum TaxID=158149 RepID=A0A9W7XC12_9POAL|nr:hypothetical protein BS78_K148400 [Paspalum vaginatum]